MTQPHERGAAQTVRVYVDWGLADGGPVICPFCRLPKWQALAHVCEDGKQRCPTDHTPLSRKGHCGSCGERKELSRHA